MIDQLLAMVKNYGQEAIVNNPEVPNELNEAAMETATNSLVDGLRGFSESDLQQLETDVANDNLDMNSQQMGFLNNNLSDGLMKNLGLNSGAAKTIGALLIPIILKQLFNKNSNGNTAGGFNIQDILGQVFGGGNAATQNPLNNGNSQGGIMDKISEIGKTMGLDKNGDGKVDLNDLGGFFGKK